MIGMERVSEMTLRIELEPVQFIARGYDRPGGYAQRVPYRLVLNVFLLGDGRARVFGAHGKFDRATLLCLGRALRGKGVTRVLIERHGVERELDLTRSEQEWSLS